MKKANFIITTFSPAMVHLRATLHVKEITVAQASKLIDDTTVIIATKSMHEGLARSQFPHASRQVGRYMQFSPGVVAIQTYYKGPPLPPDGTPPPGSMFSCYLIEAEEYIEED